MREGPTALEMAEAALELVGSDPVRAARDATMGLATARAEHPRDALAVSTALRALGLAAREVNDLPGAVTFLRGAATAAEGAGLGPAAGSARLSLAGTLMLRGDFAGARRELGRAEAALEGDAQLDVTGQLGVLAYMQGRWVEALACFDAAITGYRRIGAELDEAWALFNRGGAHMHTGRLRAADVDFSRAAELYERNDKGWTLGDVVLHLGCVATRAGDLPLALARFDRAEALYLAHGHVPAQAYLDRCEALLAARLLPEARRAAERAVARLVKGRSRSRLASARLVLSEAALLQDDYVTARDQAQQAQRAFSRQGSASWSAVARLAATRAAHAAGRVDARMLASAQSAVTDLDAAGFALAALDARLLSAQVALALGRRPEARTQLDAARAQQIGTVGARARAWHAEALLRLTDDDRRGAQSALRAGLAMLERYRATLGATELRAQASGWGADLARLGLSMAIEDGRPDAVLTWAERFRASALASLRPVADSGDDGLGTRLAELRAVVADVEESAREGQPSAALLRRQRRLEDAVRDLARQSAAGPDQDQGAGFGIRTLLDMLGPRCLVELIDHDGRLYAVIVDRRARPSRRLVDLGPAGNLAFEVDAARFALRRLVAGRRTEAGHQAAVRALDHAATRLDGQLLAPLSLDPAAPLVIVPTGSLHRLAWSLLPSCADRPIEVAPSASLWMKAATTAGTVAPGPMVLVAGPGLPGADEEVRALQHAYPRALCLSGATATVQAVTAALDGSSTAHVAAHGTFRSDNPMMSSLTLADGPLTVYDLERLRRPPVRLVLSACDSAVSDVRVGDELMGLAAALLGLGTTSVVAAVLPAPDDATRPFMVAFHAWLDKGLGPAEALSRAQEHAPNRHAVAAFVCLGAG